jgi:ligand-binding sensor domain-containing protein
MAGSFFLLIRFCRRGIKIIFVIKQGVFMKMHLFIPIFAISAVLLFAGKESETKVDSVVSDMGVWRIFNTEGAVKAFAARSDMFWYITEKGLSSMKMLSQKKADQKNYPDIGGVAGTDAICCAIDPSNIAWIGTKNGLAMRTKDSFTLLTKENGLPGNTINKILPLGGGMLWVATDDGVSLCRNGTWKTYTSKDGLVGNRVHDIAVEPNGTILFATDKGIAVFDGTAWTAYTMKNGLSGNDVKAITFDSRTNSIWAAAGERDVNCFDGKAWKVFMDVADDITSIMSDSQSRIWIAGAGALQKFNGEEWVTEPLKIGIAVSQVSQVSCDENGDLWFGMEKGILKLYNPYPH